MIIFRMKIFAMAMLSALVSAGASVAFGASSMAPAPVGLLVNGVSEPLAIDRDTTRFTWRLRDGDHGEKQTAYQILVSSNAHSLTTCVGDCWDSGKVDSDKSASVQYAGKPLPPAARLWWQV